MQCGMSELIRVLQTKAQIAKKKAQERRSDANILEGLARGFEESIIEIQKQASLIKPKKTPKRKKKKNGHS